MRTLPAPGGRFVLCDHRNGGFCPVCGERCARLWHYQADSAKLGSGGQVVGCDDCAGSTIELTSDRNPRTRDRRTGHARR